MTSSAKIETIFGKMWHKKIYYLCSCLYIYICKYVYSMYQFSTFKLNFFLSKALCRSVQTAASVIHTTVQSPISDHWVLTWRVPVFPAQFGNEAQQMEWAKRESERAERERLKRLRQQEQEDLELAIALSKAEMSNAWPPSPLIHPSVHYSDDCVCVHDGLR